MGGLIAAALGIVFGVWRQRLDVGINRERAHMTEHDEDRDADEQAGPDETGFHPAKR